MTNLPKLVAQRALWRAREKYRYQQWYNARYKGKLARAARHAEIAKWNALYEEAKTKRATLDHQIAVARRKALVSSVSPNGVNFIKSFEGYSGLIYRDSVGVPTVGYGHIEKVYPGAVWVPRQKHPGRLTETEATELLHTDLDRFYSPAVASLKLPLTQNEFDALVSFVYNVGTGAIGTSTHVGRDLRAKQYRAAGNDLLQWDRAGGNVLPGLLRRREAERKTFLS